MLRVDCRGCWLLLLLHLVPSAASAAPAADLPAVEVQWVVQNSTSSTAGDPLFRDSVLSDRKRAGPRRELVFDGLRELVVTCLRRTRRVVPDPDDPDGVLVWPATTSEEPARPVPWHVQATLSTTIRWTPKEGSSSQREVVVVIENVTTGLVEKLLESTFPDGDELDGINGWLAGSRAHLCERIEASVDRPPPNQRPEPGPFIHRARKDAVPGWVEIRPSGPFIPWFYDPTPLVGPENLVAAERRSDHRHAVDLTLDDDGRTALAAAVASAPDGLLLVAFLDGSLIMARKAPWKPETQTLSLVGELDDRKVRRLLAVVNLRH